MATTQDITLTYVLNSKASASTKNEVIRIAGGVEAKQEVVSAAINQENTPAVIEDEAAPNLTDLANKL